MDPGLDHERFDLRPHHGLALTGIVSAALVVGVEGLTTTRSVWSKTQRRVLAGICVAQVSLLSASFFAPLGSIVHQRTFDVSIFLAIAASTVIIGRSPRFRAIILASLGVGIALGAILGLVAFATSSDFLLGDRFRGRVTLLGDEPRLTRPFSHANIAAMFFAPCAAGMLAVAAFTTGRKRLLSVVIAALLTSLTVLTVSRAGVISLILGVGVLVWVAGRTSARWILGGLLAGLVVAVPFSPAVIDRVSGTDRFAARVVPPVELTLEETTTVSISVTNESSDLWPATGRERVRLTARWRDLDQERQWITHVWPMPKSLGPGESVEVPVQIPIDVPDGTYVAVWDLLVDREAFFLESRGDQALSLISVAGSTSSLSSGPVVRSRMPPRRVEIWGWALELFVDRPWFGHGVGMMRFVVSDVTDGSRAVASSHAHNLALEPLSASGLVGAVPFLTLLGLLVVDLATRIRRVGPVGVIVGIALVVMLVHGLVEWPLMFPSLAALFAILAGLWCTVRQDVASV